MSLPRTLNSRAIAAHIGWDRQRVQRILKKMGIARQYSGAHGAIYVEIADLAAAWPEVYEALVEKLGEIEDLPDGRGNKPGFNANKQGGRMAVTIRDNTSPVYDYDAHPCSYELEIGWSCAPECANEDHKIK